MKIARALARYERTRRHDRETDNPKAMFECRAQWADLMEMTITPCLEDADAGAVLAAMAKH